MAHERAEIISFYINETLELESHKKTKNTLITSKNVARKKVK